MSDPSKIDDAWDALLGDAADVTPAPPVPLDSAQASEAEEQAVALPPPPTFIAPAAPRKRGDSVVESMQALMGDPAPGADEPDADEPDADESVPPPADPSSSGSMQEVWSELWPAPESGDALQTDGPTDDSVAVKLPEAPAEAQVDGPAEPGAVEGPISDSHSIDVVRPPARPAVEAAVRRAPRPSASSPALDSPASGSSRALFIGVALVAAATVAGFALFRGEDGAPADTDPGPAIAGGKGAARAPSAPPAPDDRARREEASASGSPHTAHAAAVAPGVAADEPDPSGATADDSDDSDDSDDARAEADPVAPVDDPSPAAGAGATDYEAAAAEYEASGSEEALASMVKLSCAMDDGVRARSAFRKLGARELRVEALLACKKTEIDPTLSADGPTPAELARKARRQLQAGDAAAAMSTARESNRLERNPAALVVMTLAACALSDADEARRLRRHVKRDDRAEVDEGCRAHGIDPMAPE